MKRFVNVLVLAVSLVGISGNAFAYSQYSGSQDEQTGFDQGDAAIVRAAQRKARVNFVEGAGMEVVKVLPDDTTGLEHQKWVVRLSDGQNIEAVYNTDMCPHVPIQVGDIVAMGGMFLWTNQGGLIHWLHHDPRGNRPDGYVMVNGTYYCKE